MSVQPLLPHDDRIRAALTREPSAGAAGSVFAGLVLELERTPQVRRGWIGWLGRSAMPGIAPTPARRTLGTLALCALAVLALLASLAVVAFVGAHRHAPPFGLARAGDVVYDSAGNLFLANPDGTNPRQVTSGADQDLGPAFSPDGTQLAYLTLVDGTTDVRLTVANSDGTQARVLALLAASERATGIVGTSLRHLAWSPDGTRIAYTAPVDGLPQVFIVAVDGGAPVPIGAPGLEGQDPVWSPDGTRIAIRGGRFDVERGIYVLNADGTGLPVLITQPREVQVTRNVQFSIPSWSPDGAFIAFSEVLPTSESHIVVAPAAGGEARDISGPGHDDWWPAWSPDGAWLAWRSSDSVGWGAGAIGGLGQFTVARPDGSQRSTLPPIVIGTPVWSPDGRTLMGAAPDPATSQADRLLLIDIVTSETVAIPASSGTEPSWQRLRP